MSAIYVGIAVFNVAASTIFVDGYLFVSSAVNNRCIRPMLEELIGGTEFNKLKQLSNAVTLQLNHALSTPPDNFCLQPKKMYYPLFIKAILFTNFVPQR